MTTIALVACSFQGNGRLVDDAAVDAMVDAFEPPPDLPPDMPPSQRVQAGLVALWNFDDDSAAPVFADTSGFATPVPLEIQTPATFVRPTIANGVATATQPGRAISDPMPHLATTVVAGGGVTLEAWVMPASATQGAVNSPAFIAGLASTVASRDVVITQNGTKWAARVRTPNLDGTPELVSTINADPGKFTHLVIVADGTRRILYVDGAEERVGVAAPLAAWGSYQFALFDEPQRARNWLGGMALVAVYDRALTELEIQQNFAAGHDAF